MPRNMSFSMTTEAIRDRTKTVTRRLGWWTLGPGDLLIACEKCQGLKKGEKVVRLATIRVLGTSWEPLSDIELYGSQETAREGFPELGPNGFVDMFCRANRCDPWDLVNRIEFEYLEPQP